MITEKFAVPSRFKTTGLVLLVLGILTLIGGFISLVGGSSPDPARFWIGLLQNSVYFLFIVIASIFIQAAAGLAHGAWIVAFRRVPEAIGATTWIFGLITLVVLFSILYLVPDKNLIYHWIDPGNDKIVQGKTAFLNRGLYVAFSIVTVGLWSWFGIKFRNNSIQQQTAPRNSTKIYWKNVALSGAFLFVFALTLMSTTPWLWLMSINAHWYSTMYSWYVFASSFVAGMALILLFVVYLKNQGKLQLVNKEHIHDLGKYMFAFSIFWTYLWFSQFMLIWYSNISEETAYFILRAQGPYSVIFYLALVINFVLPILILMSRPSKRNYFLVVFIAIAIIFGHWLDFYIMAVPEVLLENWTLGWFELGIPLGFIGILMLSVSNILAKDNLVPVNNVLLKETINHVS